MHSFWAPPSSVQSSVRYKENVQHTDYVTIPGVKTETLQQAFRIEYGKETGGIDVLVVAGMNNIQRGDSMEELM